jgi:hypothetical protein
MLLMRRLGNIGAPLPVAASAEEAVDMLFHDGHSHMDAMQDLLPMLKNTSKISPIEGWRLD